MVYINDRVLYSSEKEWTRSTYVTTDESLKHDAENKNSMTTFTWNVKYEKNYLLLKETNMNKSWYLNIKKSCMGKKDKNWVQ